MPECLIRLCDTRGEIRAAYSALLEVVPTHILTSFSSGIDTFQPPNGRKGVEGVRSCRGTWHARRVHMTKQSQVTFHGHHFKAIMGFIMHGYAPRYAICTYQLLLDYVYVVHGANILSVVYTVLNCFKPLYTYFA